MENREENRGSRRGRGAYALAAPYGIWMTIFIVVPLFIVLYYGITTAEGRPTFENIAAMSSSLHLKALWLSLKLSFLSTLFCLALAYPLAMILSRKKLKGSSIVIMLFILPMWMNFLLRTMAWQTLLEKNGVINGILQLLRLPAVNIINTPTAIVLGMVYNFLPFMILPLYNTLLKIDKDVIDAARDLGAGSVQTFLKIILPLSLPGIISGVTMVFVPALTTFVISDMLGGGKILLIGNVIEQEFRLSNWHTGAGLSLVLMVFIIISMAVMSKYDKEAEGAGVW